MFCVYCGETISKNISFIIFFSGDWAISLVSSFFNNYKRIIKRILLFVGYFLKVYSLWIYFGPRFICFVYSRL